MTCALLFSGQGTQHAGMLPWLEASAAAAPTLAAMQAITGTDWRTRLEDPQQRSANDFAQPLVVGTALAAWAALAPMMPGPPAIVAGYSVGELAAFAAAGVFTADNALALAQARARMMDEAAPAEATGLVAISGLAAAAVLRACPALECAIQIDVDNNVYGGTAAALEQAANLLGTRATLKPLDVKIASHTSWMRAASHRFAIELAGRPLSRPSCPIATCFTGAPARDPAELADALARQISHPLMWSDVLAAVAERLPSCVLEIGPGQALARMWNTRFPDIPARSLDEFRGPEGAAAWAARFV